MQILQHFFVPGCSPIVLKSNASKPILRCNIFSTKLLRWIRPWKRKGGQSLWKNRKKTPSPESRQNTAGNHPWQIRREISRWFQGNWLALNKWDKLRIHRDLLMFVLDWAGHFLKRASLLRWESDLKATLILHQDVVDGLLTTIFTY